MLRLVKYKSKRHSNSWPKSIIQMPIKAKKSYLKKLMKPIKFCQKYKLENSMIRWGRKRRTLPKDSPLLMKIKLIDDENSRIKTTTILKDLNNPWVSLNSGKKWEGIIKKWWRERLNTVKILMIWVEDTKIMTVLHRIWWEKKPKSTLKKIGLLNNL